MGRMTARVSEVSTLYSFSAIPLPRRYSNYMHYRATKLWQKAILATCEVYRLAPRLPRAERYGMRSQITRAATSIPANIAEGWARESPKDKAHFMAIVHASLAEAETLLTLCEDQGWFPWNETRRLRELLDEVSRMLTAVRRGFRKRGKSGKRK